MSIRILHIGIDVDDKSFHIGAFCKETGEVFEMTSKPNLGNLMKKLQKFKDQNSCLLPRIRKQSKLYSRTNAGRLFRGLKILGLKNQRVTDLTFLEKSNCAGEGETCVSLALNQQGTCFVQRVAVALEGAKE